MQITCDHCRQSLLLPDDKVPSRPFTIKCPKCQEAVAVDPTRTGADPPPPASTAEAPSPAAPAAPPLTPSSPTPTAAPSAPSNEAAVMAPLRAHDRALLDTMLPTAAIVGLDGTAIEPAIAEGLAAIDIHDAEVFDDLATAVGVCEETPVGVLVLRLARASTPPCAPLEPLEHFSGTVRRRTLIALVADNVRSLDGQLAFYLEVDCAIATADLAQLPALLRRALLHNLHLYRHWDDEAQLGS